MKPIGMTASKDSDQATTVLSSISTTESRQYLNPVDRVLLASSRAFRELDFGGLTQVIQFDFEGRIDLPALERGIQRVGHLYPVTVSRLAKKKNARTGSFMISNRTSKSLRSRMRPKPIVSPNR